MIGHLIIIKESERLPKFDGHPKLMKKLTAVTRAKKRHV